MRSKLLYYWIFLHQLAGLWLVGLLAMACTPDIESVLLEDDFGDLRIGLFSSDVVGAHAEYHYIRAVAPQGNWVVSAFRSNGSQRAWRVQREGDTPVMVQSYTSSDRERAYTHPMIIAGDPFWRDYTVTVTFRPESHQGQSGLLFRYRNDRCYYFLGISGQQVLLKVVTHGPAYRQANETILAQADIIYNREDLITAVVTIKGSHIRAWLNDTLLEADDTTFDTGKIGLMSDVPTRYYKVKVTTTPQEKQHFEYLKAQRQQDEARLQAANPNMVVWKKIGTDGFGVGRNVRFGDLNNDGQPDVLICQPRHHGPKDRNSEVGCLTAMTFDGEILWQIGEPDLWKDNLTNDVAFQIHDLDGDGRTEVVYAQDMELRVIDGATGETRYKAPTPENRNATPPYDRFPRILGDALYFCDLRGTGHPRDLILKDRYRQIWALNDRLKIMWSAACNTGHYPYARDIDGDGKDELAIGYSLFDDDGTLLWSLDDQIRDHADGVAIVNFQSDEDASMGILNAASDEGMIFMDTRGNILKHHQLGHVQNPSVANYRDDLPGLETVSVNFWGNQGIIHYFDAKGDLYYDFEPVQHGSMMLPVNWTGKSEEFYVLSANVDEGGLYDGWGRRVVSFPADGHPDLCNAVLDIIGDCRDEIVVWDAQEMWVYTQDDNPKTGRLYQPERNPLYNYSNYQATVSLPGWSE